MCVISIIFNYKTYNQMRQLNSRANTAEVASAGKKVKDLIGEAAVINDPYFDTIANETIRLSDMTITAMSGSNENLSLAEYDEYMDNATRLIFLGTEAKCNCLMIQLVKVLRLLRVY